MRIEGWNRAAGLAIAAAIVIAACDGGQTEFEETPATEEPWPMNGQPGVTPEMGPEGPPPDGLQPPPGTQPADTLPPGTAQPY